MNIIKEKSLTEEQYHILNLARRGEHEANDLIVSISKLDARQMNQEFAEGIWSAVCGAEFSKGSKILIESAILSKIEEQRKIREEETNEFGDYSRGLHRIEEAYAGGSAPTSEEIARRDARETLFGARAKEAARNAFLESARIDGKQPGEE